MLIRTLRGSLRSACLVSLLLASVLVASFARAAPAGVYPAGMVAFVVSEDGSCPEGWGVAKYAQGRLILSVNHQSQAMLGFGDPIRPQTAPTHTHGYTVSITLGDRVNLGDWGGVILGASGTWKTQGTSTAADSGYPFIQLSLCENLQEPHGDDNLPFGTLAYFDTASCPQSPRGSWQPFTATQGRFLLPAPEGATSTGVTVGTPWSAGSSPGGHSHFFESTINLNETTVEWLFPDTPGFAYPESVALFFGVTPDAPSVPGVSLLTCQKIESTGDGAFSEPIAILMDGGCPPGWSSFEAAAGRFLVGRPTGGSQGATFGGPPMTPGETTRDHHHDASGSLTIGQKGTSEPGISRDWSFVASGSYPFSFPLFPANSAVPFYTVSFCTPDRSR